MIYQFIFLLLIIAGAPLASGATDADYLKLKDLTPITIHPTPKHKPIPIVSHGQARAKIYVPQSNPVKTLKIMIGELVQVIEASTGVRLEITHKMPPQDQPAIVLGDCVASRNAGIDADTIPIEGFVVKTAAKRLYLVGSRRKLPVNDNIGNDFYSNDGLAWAVADFLERFVGVRWYWPTQAGGRSIVKSEELVILPMHYSDQPVFRKRTCFPLRYQKPWIKSRKQKMPLSFPYGIPEKIEEIDMLPFFASLRAGNSWPYIVKVHQPQYFAYEPDKWKQHRAMFQKKKDGSADYRMLCYSSQEAFDYLIAGCEDFWDKGKRDVPWVTSTCVTVSPGDYPVNCYCNRCQKLFEPHKNGYAQASMLMGRFVKKFASEVLRRWPSKKVLYLPYWNYTLCPEEIDFPANLEIQMCTMAFALMRQHGERALIEHSLRAWSQKAGGKIQTWEYSDRVTTWMHVPLQFPNLVQDYYRKNRDIIVGSFLNGGDSLAQWSVTAPTLYCWLKILWNPDIDIKAVLDEFCKRMFGPAAGAMRELIQLMCDCWEKSYWSQPQGDNRMLAPVIFNETWRPEVVATMEKIWNRARMQLAHIPLCRQRFEYFTLTFRDFIKEAQAIRGL